MVNNLLNQVKRLKIRKIRSKNGQLMPAITGVTPTRYFHRKYLLDFCLAVLLLLPGLILMLIFMALIRLTSRGPAIYRQYRAGLNGRKFRMYKIRSMTHDAEYRMGPVWTQPADSRVTLVGHFLRKFHLDELPQLINVLKGEMSLVGPRPERPEFVEFLSRHIPDYVNRLAVRPGITGLAQLNLPPDNDLNSVRRKIVLDIEYIQTANLWLDLKLICCTAFRLTKLPILRLFRVKRIVDLPTLDIEKQQPVVSDKVVTLKQLQQEIEKHTPGGDHGKLHRSRNRRTHWLRPK
jgi:lipopolysaccharide/colanic/teichoic acid biosynthesis glycosyltransferase